MPNDGAVTSPTDGAPGAGNAYLSALAASTRDPLLARAAIAMLEGRPADAERVLRDLLCDRPSDVAAIHLMAELLVQVGRFDDAIRLSGRAVELAPDFSEARALLARTLQRHNRPGEALVHVERLYASDPLNLSMAMLKASLLVQIGDQPGAARLYAGTLAVQPAQPGMWTRYAHVLRTIGLIDEAIVAYREALALQPTLGEAWWGLANLKTYRFTPADVDCDGRGIGTDRGGRGSPPYLFRARQRA